MTKRYLDPCEAARFYKDGVDQALRERDIDLLVHFIRRPPAEQEARDYLAQVIEGLLTKKIGFPNRKPKQDLEGKRQALAERVWEIKKEKGWKLRSVVDSVANEMRCSPRTVWSAWRVFVSRESATNSLPSKSTESR